MGMGFRYCFLGEPGGDPGAPAAGAAGAALGAALGDLGAMPTNLKLHKVIRVCLPSFNAEK